MRTLGLTLSVALFASGAAASPTMDGVRAVGDVNFTLSDTALSSTFTPRMPSSSRATPSSTACVTSDTLTGWFACGQLVKTM